MGLTFLVAEPDLLFHLFPYLSLTSVARLQATCRLFNDFIRSKQRRIRGLLNVDFFFSLGHEARVGNVHLQANPEGFARENFHIRVVQKSARPNVFGVLCCHIDDLELLKEKGKKHFTLLVDDMNATEIILRLAEFFLPGFRFIKAEFGLVGEEGLLAVEKLCEWFIREEVTIDEVGFGANCPDEKRLICLVEPLKVKSLHIANRWTNDFHSNPNKRYSREFFQQLPLLRRFTAQRLDCDIGDEELAQFDVLRLGIAASSVTKTGILQWLARKFDCEKVDVELEMRCLATVAEIESELGKNYFSCENVEEGFFDFNVRRFRSATGRWLWFQRDSQFQPGVFHLRTTTSYWDSIMQVSNNFSLRIACVKVEAVVDDDIATAELRCDHSGMARCSFNISNEKPTGPGVLLLERWTDDVVLYEVDFCQFVILVDTEIIDDEKLKETLRLLTRRLTIVRFNEMRCCSPGTNSSLKLILMLQAGLPEDLRIHDLWLLGQSALSESILLPIIRRLRINSLTIKTFSNECPLSVPLHLSSKFFEETPSLTSLKMGDNSSVAHFLGLNDATIQRFEELRATTASTNVTAAGFHRWITRRVEETDDLDAYDIRLAAPLPDEPLRQKEFVREIKKGLSRRCYYDLEIRIRENVLRITPMGDYDSEESTADEAE